MVGGQAPNVVRVLAWPYRRSTNPYTRHLYDAMQEACAGRVHVEEFRFADAWRRRVDVVHVHWPEAAVESKSTMRAAVKCVALLATLHVLRRRGATIVWTAHNLRSHESHHPWLEALLRAQFFRLVEGVIHLSPGSVAEVGREIPAVHEKPAAVVRHGLGHAGGRTAPSRSAARAALGIEDGELVWLAAGAIRPYKQTPSLINAFIAADLPNARLIVAGRPTSSQMAAEVEAAASKSPVVSLLLGWMDEVTFANHLAAADVVVCCYAELLNSGVVVRALAEGRPVLCRRSCATEDLATMVGDEWVALLDHPLTANALGDHEPWARSTRSGPPDLEQLSPDTIARATLAAYEKFIDSRAKRLADAVGDRFGSDAGDDRVVGRVRTAALAGLGSGAPSTVVAVARGDDVLRSTRAAGTLLVGDGAGAGTRLVAGAAAHAGISMFWTIVLWRVLPRRNTLVAGAAAGLAIAALDLGVIGRRFPAIRRLRLAPQIADHVAFGLIVAWGRSRAA